MVTCLISAIFSGHHFGVRDILPDGVKEAIVFPFQDKQEESDHVTPILFDLPLWTLA